MPRPRFIANTARGRWLQNGPARTVGMLCRKSRITARTAAERCSTWLGDLKSHQPPTLYHTVYDEAGDTGFRAGSSRYLVGAAVLCHSLHDLQRVAWAVRKDAHKGHVRLPELKARLVPPWLVYEGLRHALHWDWQAVVAVVDKGARQDGPDDREEIYRRLTAHVVTHCVRRHPLLHFVADKRYTNPRQRDQLTEAIQSAIAAANLNAVLTVEQVSSEQHQELLLADYLAWALFQKYERGDREGYDFVRDRIAVEDVIKWRSLLSSVQNAETAWRPGGRFSPFETE